MSALTPYRQAQIDYARRELHYALRRLDIAEHQDARDQAVALHAVYESAHRLGHVARRYDLYLQGTYR